MKDKLSKIFVEVFTKQSPGIELPNLTDDLVLLESGLDSLGFAVLVVEIEQQLGMDPFTASDEMRRFTPLPSETLLNFMKATNLRQRIAEIHQLNPQQTLVIAGGHNLTLEKLSVGFQCDVDWRVIVCCQKPIHLIDCLCSLDSIAESVCPISPLLSDEDKIAILKQYDFTHLVTDLAEIDISVFEGFGLEIINYNQSQKHLTKADELASVDTVWLVPTSGTTASPKLVSHTLGSLTEHVKVKSTFADPAPVWGLFYDITRYAGYQVLFQSLLGGGKLVIPGMKASLIEQIAEFVLAGVTHISATPTMWRKILMCPARDQLNLKHIILGGEAADQQILSALNKAFKFANITHVYASTEAGVGLSVSDAKAGFPMSFIEDCDHPVKIKTQGGRLYLRSPSAAHGYTSSEKIKDDDGWVDTGDLVRIEGQRFFVTGRASGVLNVGGDKVVPEQIRHVLLECDLIQDAVVYGKRNPFTGYLIMADVELKKGGDGTDMQKALKAFIDSRLPSIQRPQIVNFVSSICMTSAGKAKVR